MGIIIVSILFAALFIGIFWIILYFPTKWFITEKYSKKIRWIISILLGSYLTYYILFTSAEYNQEYAILIQKDDIYELTLTGERVYLSHDPISAINRDTFTDTMVLILPRNKGEIKGIEIIQDDGYPLLGRININDGIINIELFYDNYDDHLKDPFSYNGNYKLKK